MFSTLLKGSVLPQNVRIVFAATREEHTRGPKYPTETITLFHKCPSLIRSVFDRGLSIVHPP